MMSFDELSQLKNLARPPLKPLYTGSSSQWQAYEEEWGVRFPLDYREFIQNYGSGLFLNEFGVHSPFESRHLIARHKDYLQGKSNIVCFETEREWDIWPKCGGMLQFGGDSDGNSYYWKTGVDPDKWTVSLFSSGFFEEEHWECSLVEYLVKLLSGEIKSKIMWRVSSDDSRATPDKIFIQLPE